MRLVTLLNIIDGRSKLKKSSCIGNKYVSLSVSLKNFDSRKHRVLVSEIIAGLDSPTNTNMHIKIC